MKVNKKICDVCEAKLNSDGWGWHSINYYGSDMGFGVMFPNIKSKDIELCENCHDKLKDMIKQGVTLKKQIKIEKENRALRKQIIEIREILKTEE